MNPIILSAAAMSLLVGNPAGAAELSQRTFGTMPDGRLVPAITLANRHGMSVTLIALGASMQSVIVPDARGRKADVLLGHASLGEYRAKRQFMGATVGRVANRIGGGRFALDGRSYEVSRNDGGNTLHGGAAGFDQAVWDVTSTEEGKDGAEVSFRLVSPDGDQGFPGKVEVTVRYRLDERDQLTITYAARTDRPTVMALSSHGYWNLAGEGAPGGALGQLLLIPAEHYTPVDIGLIPTGEMRAVAGTTFDFRRSRPIGERVRNADDAQIGIGRGYDHNWVVTRAPTATPHLMARASDPVSGRTMEVWSDQPGLQFYSGNFLDGTTKGKSGQFYRQGDAIVLEPQAFPDTVNRPEFGNVRLDPKRPYHATISYKFQVCTRGECRNLSNSSKPGDAKFNKSAASRKQIAS